MGDKAANIVSDKPYEISDTTVDSPVATLRNSGAEVFLALVAPKAAVQAIRKVAELGWKPTFILINVSSSVPAVMKPAGFENAQGVISPSWMKEPSSALWKADPAMREYIEFMDKHYPAGDRTNWSNLYGYFAAQLMAQVLRQCGDDLTRENVMRQAASIRNWTNGALLPGIFVNTSSTDYFPIEQLQLMRFTGEAWELFGEVIDAAPK